MPRRTHTMLLLFLIFNMLEMGSYAQVLNDSIDDSLQGASDLEKAEVYFKMADKNMISSLGKSLDYANLALEIAMEQHDTILIARCYGKIGKIYYEAEMYHEALENYQIENQLSQKARYIPGLERSFEELGKTHHALNDTVLSLGFFKEALAIAQFQKDTQKLGEKHFNIAEVYYGSRAYDSAQVHFNTSIDFFILSEDTINIVRCLQSLGRVLQMQGDYPASRKLLFRALNLAVHKDLEYEMAHIAYNVALSLQGTGNTEAAGNHLEMALKICLDEGFYKLASEIYRRLAEFSLAEGDNKLALDYQKKAFTFVDSLRRSDQKSKLKFLEMKYDYEMSRNELNLLRLNNDIQSAKLDRQKRIGLFTIISLFIFFVALLISIRIFYLRRKVVKSLEEKQLQLEKTHRELLISEQNLKNLNDTKNKLFSILAHDLINPFNSLLAFTALLNEGSQSLEKDKIKEYSKVIYQTAQNLYQLLENLLQWSRSQTGKIILKKESICLNALVDNVIALVQVMANRKSINIKTDLNALDNVLVDPNLMSAAIRNLVQNAIKFTPENKTITITTRNETHGRIIEVIDTGLGISEENQRKLFRTDMHYTTNGTANEKGAGLGLIIAKEFIEINGGQLKVASEKGKGSIFTIEIPS